MTMQASHRARSYYFGFNLMFQPDGLIEYGLLQGKR